MKNSGKISARTEFEKWKLAGSLPSVIILQRDYPPLPLGAISPMATSIPVTRIMMKLIFFTTPKRVHGLLHYEGLAQLCFMGYECSSCDQVFLVPAEVGSEGELAKSLRHSCMCADGEDPHP